MTVVTKRLVKPLRLLVWACVLAASAYLLLRFDLASLPAGSCSPLRSISSGDRMWIDRRPRAPITGDIVLFEDPNSELYLIGRVVEAPEGLTPEVVRALTEGALWIEGDNSDCALRDSRLLGPVAVGAVVGRVILTF